MVKANCSHCSKGIHREPNELNRSNNLFCSKECHDEFQKNLIKDNCKYCGNEISYRPSEKKKFCDRSCSAKYRESDNRVMVTCEKCETEFEQMKSRTKDQERQFCSTKCTSDWRARKWSGEDNPNYRNGKYRQFGSNWINVRKEAWERAGGECEIFGKTEEENGRRLSAHHILPRRAFIQSEYFTVEDSNFQLNIVVLCQSCHIKAESNERMECPAHPAE